MLIYKWVQQFVMLILNHFFAVLNNLNRNLLNFINYNIYLNI